MRNPGARVTVPAAILALLLALALAAPTAARYGLVKLLNDQLQVPVSIEDVDLDLLDGEARIHNLQISGNAGSDLLGGDLYADMDMGALLRGKIVAEAVRLEGLRLEILRAEDGRVVVVVPLDTADNDDTSEAAFEIPLFELDELVIVDAELDIDLPPLRGRMRLEQSRLTGLTTLAPEPAELTLEADWNGATIEVNGRLAPFEPWFDGELSLAKLDLREAEPYLPAPLGTLGGMLEMRWRGRVSARELSLEGALTLEDVQAVAKNLQIHADALSWNGSLDLAALTETPELKLSGDVNGGGLGVRDRDRNLALFRLAGVLAEQLVIDKTGAVSVANMAFEDMRAVDTGEGERQLLQGKALQVRDFAFHDNKLQVGSITGEEVVSNLYFNKEGGLEARGVLTASLEALLEQREEADESTPLSWRVGETTARDSRLTVIDRQFEHPLRIELAVEDLRLGTVDSSRPDTPSDLSLKSRVGEYGRIDIDGHITGLAPESDTALKGSISSLALPTLSPYSEYLLGYELVAGQYDHDFDLEIKDAHITASNELALRKTKVKKMAGAEPVAPLPMPLDMALDMLRDRKDNITLSVPLDGQLDDPEFGMNQAISRALGKALQAGSTTYLKFILQPYGAIWTGAEMGLKLIGKVQLDPMPFPAGSAELGQAQLDYAGKLATMLTERPGIELQACGKAGQADYEALPTHAAASPEQPTGDTDAAPAFTPEQTRQMLELAEQRSNALKRWLVSEKGIAPERIYPCKPTADPEGDVSGIRLGV